MKQKKKTPTVDLCRFIDKFAICEDGQPLRLEPHQRRILGKAFKFGKDGRLTYRTVIYSAPKKSGKTAVNALVTLWWAFCIQPPDEIIIASNDLDQAVSRVYDSGRGFIERNPALRAEAYITRNLITLDNGTTIKAIPSDYAGEAGANQGLASFDELWGFMSERSRRLYEELTPVPTRKNSIRFISTYAGWEGESVLLEEIYQRVFDKQGNVKPGVNRPLGEDFPVYTLGDLFVFWDHIPRMSWQTPEYYASQRADLRLNTFLRLHENRWVSNESSFFEMDQWDACVDPEHRPPLPNPRLQLWAAADASVKRDRSAVVSIYREGNQVCLGPMREWQPSPRATMDYENTMEEYVKWLASNFALVEVRYDPYQFHRSATTLRGMGINMQEYPQTVGNLTDIGQALYDAVKHRTLRLYADNELRREASFAVGKETPRGMRIVKEKASHKIDAIVALAMAVHAASTAPESEQPWELRYAIDPNSGYRFNEFGERVSPRVQNIGGQGKDAFYVRRKSKEIWDRDF
ncbi:MAG: terminase family protein [Proteobacteria bacterium]|nr:terminase family protein [Pseudomonadota bacterium]